MGRDLPALFRKLKKMPYFAKKKPNCVHLWVKFLIYDTVLRLSREKKLLFMCCRRNVCRSALILRNLPSPKKILDVPPASKCHSPNTSCKTNGNTRKSNDVASNTITQNTSTTTEEIILKNMLLKT